MFLGNSALCGLAMLILKRSSKRHTVIEELLRGDYLSGLGSYHKREVNEELE